MIPTERLDILNGPGMELILDVCASCLLLFFVFGAGMAGNADQHL